MKTLTNKRPKTPSELRTMLRAQMREDIAAAAKVGKGTVYRYFKNKEDLFHQTASSGFEELCEVIREGEAGDGSFGELLLGACGRISEFFKRRRQLFRMIHSEQLRMPWQHGEARERWRARPPRGRRAVPRRARPG